MVDRTKEFFQAAAKFGYKPKKYLEIKVGDRHHMSYNNSYIIDGVATFRKIGETNNLLKHLIMNSQSSIFDASQKMTIQIKDEITGINFEINDLKTAYKKNASTNKNSEDDDKN